MKIKNVHNAFTIIEINNSKIVCDPWITEGLFDGTWGKFPCIKDIEDYITGTTHCFISHVHQDHMDVEAIKLMDKTTRFYIPDIYPNHIIKNMLNKMGFGNVSMLKPLQKFEIIPGIYFNVIPPMNGGGLVIDKKDEEGTLAHLSVDAGLVIEDTIEKGKVVLLSDNGPYKLNSKLEEAMKDSDLIAFPFNGVADNYPICFSNMTLKEKQEASLKRQSNRAILQSKTFNTLKPKNIMPYSSDIVILGPRAKDFVDVHPIEYVDRKLVSKIYKEKTNIPTHAVCYNNDIIIKNNKVTIKGEYIEHNFKSYAYSKYSEDPNPIITHNPVDKEVLQNNFKLSCDNMFNMMDKLKLKSDWILCFNIEDLNINFSVNLKTKKIKFDTTCIYNNNKVQTLTIPSGYLNEHFIFNHHWNNSVISHNLNWHRTIDEYCGSLESALNFLHINQTIRNTK